MHKYTKKQIVKSIKFWQNILEENTLDDYKRFFCKDKDAHKFKSMNIAASQHLASAINESCIKNWQKDDICIYNGSSYMNKTRLHEHASLYINERQQTTQPTSELIEKLKQYCKHDARDWPNGISRFEDMFKIEAYDYDPSGKIAGNIILLDFPFDTTHCTLSQHINRISRIALSLGYNYVVHEETGIEQISGKKFNYVSIQFEATYFSSNVKYGDILWHVAPKSYASKIMKYGLLPNNKNQTGFSYESRVYCFVDKNDELFSMYAGASRKQSKTFILSDKLKDELKDWYQLVQDKTTGKLFDTKEFVVFAIDTSKLKDTMFFRDNTFDIDGNFVAAYTMQAIPPNAIKLVDEFVTD